MRPSGKFLIHAYVELKRRRQGCTDSLRDRCDVIICISHTFTSMSRCTSLVGYGRWVSEDGVQQKLILY